MLTTIGRAATKRLVSVTATSTITASTSSGRVAITAAKLPSLQQLNVAGTRFTAVRGFAAAKATTTKKKTATTTTAKKAAPKKTATATKAKAKTTKAKKTVTKSKAKKAAAKKPAPRGRKRKPLSEDEKLKLEKRALKKRAQFAEPKLLPETPWVAYLTEKIKGTSIDPADARTRFTDLAASYKSLSAPELRRLEEISQKNKLANAATYKSWVESLTPVEVSDANVARRHLKNKFNHPKGTLKLILDPRQPKRPRSAFALFTKARWASGDINSSKISEASGIISKEWKTLPENEKQPFLDQAQVDMARYEKDLRSILGREVTPRKTA